MPIYYLFIASLVFFTFLLPERVLYFLRTITKWLAHRQAIRESWNIRQDEVHAAYVAWKAWTDSAYQQLKRRHTAEEKIDWLSRMLAAGQRYLNSVSPDEAPTNYEKTVRFCHAAEELLAEIRTLKNNTKRLATLHRHGHDA